MTVLYRVLRKLARHRRGLLLALLVRAAGGQCALDLECERGVCLRWGPHRGIRIGQGVRLGRGVILDVPKGAELTIGDRAKVMHYCVLASSNRVAIGQGTQIGELCSIRDADHVVGLSGIASEMRVADTQVGANVWVGRGVAVLRGARIGDGATVGANSVVLGNTDVPAGSTVVGAPARVVSSQSDLGNSD